jgi:secreted Zn-dependent insulinase-like peptidase
MLLLALSHAPHQTKHHQFISAGDVVLADQRRRLIKVVPQKETDSLMMQWPIPPQCTQYQTLPSLYLSHLIG